MHPQEEKFKTVSRQSMKLVANLSPAGVATFSVHSSFEGETSEWIGWKKQIKIDRIGGTQEGRRWLVTELCKMLVRSIKKDCGVSHVKLERTES